MRTQRLGCLTVGGILSGLLVVLLMIVAGILTGGEMFSPGPLHASHTDIPRCADCHAAPWAAERMNDRCLACHTEVAVELRTPESLHATIWQRNGVGECRACHPDHRGAQASLTLIDEAGFPHEAAGYSLTGHPRIECQACHVIEYDFNLPTCVTCHEKQDAEFVARHRQDFGDGCLGCHDGLDTYGSDFDHGLSSFPLSGSHAQTDCAACHAGGRTIADLRSTPVDCLACHRADDPHEGRFGTDCGSCHTADGWKPATFDHDLAAFKLDGKHVDVACEDCHTTESAQATPSDCFSCHQAVDAHGGRFGSDCSACHTTAGWKPATFDHSRSKFPLTEAHARLLCENCHAVDTYQGLSPVCASCHPSPGYHAGLFGNMDCSSCHNRSAWLPASYNLKHQFKIRHEETNGQCRNCHPATLAAYSCAKCHEGGVPREDGGGRGGGDDD